MVYLLSGTCLNNVDEVKEVLAEHFQHEKREKQIVVFCNWMHFRGNGVLILQTVIRIRTNLKKKHDNIYDELEIL
jgi:hypothetical protein